MLTMRPRQSAESTFVLSLAAVACDVCAPTNPQIQLCREGSTDRQNHLSSVFSSTHPDLPDDLWDRLLPYAEITLNVLGPWRPDPTLSAWSGLHHLPYDFSAHPLHPPGQLCLAFSTPDHRDTWTLTGIALLPLAQPLPTTDVNVFMSSPPALNASPSP